MFKNISIFILIGVIIYLIVNSFLDKREQTRTLLNSQDSIRVWKDKAGNIYSEHKALALTYKELKKQSKIIDITNKQLEYQVKNLKNLVTTSNLTLIEDKSTKMKLRDTIIYIIDTLNIIDTIETKKFAYNDKWINLKGYLLKDSVFVKYKSFNNIRLNTFYKRDKWYEDKYPIVQLVNDNPNLVASNMSSIVIEPPKKKLHEKRGFAFAVGLTAGFLLSIGVVISK